MADTRDQSFYNSLYMLEIKGDLNLSKTVPKHCDDTRASSCSSSGLIGIFYSSSYPSTHMLPVQSQPYLSHFDSISLDVPKRPPRLI